MKGVPSSVITMYEKGLSVAQISRIVKISEGRINNYFKQKKIIKRSISEGVYLRNNPNGNPYFIRKKFNKEQIFILGLGLGLFWGEGNKKNMFSVRLGNSDPFLIATFLNFLKEIYSIDSKKLKFGLQLFTDISAHTALNFWLNFLKVNKKQFYKVTTTVSGKVGTYKTKSKYGVVTIYFHNKKLRDVIVNQIENLKQLRYKDFWLDN